MSVDTMQRIALAAVCLSGLALLMPPLARGVGGVLMFLGVCGLSKHQGWAGPTLASGLCLWLVGHWSYAARTGRYKSRLAVVVLESYLLRWTLPHYHRYRRQIRAQTAP